MSIVDAIIHHLPEVTAPTEKKLGFGRKFKWTAVILVIYFVLGQIELFGVATSALSEFANLAVILGAKFGTLISLGIGPIVTASIVLQLLNGSGIVSFDTATDAGRKRFQGIQKLLAYGFIIFEAIIYVLLGGLAPAVGAASYGMIQFLIIVQLFIGGVIIMLMDEICQKWGFGSGISLFIAAGVAQQIMVQMFSWVKTAGSPYSVGAVWSFIQSIQAGDGTVAILSITGIFFTLLVFAASIYVQAMKVEIPLSFGRVRGHGIRWPLNFLYTSNIPVILIAALLANLQILARLIGGAGNGLQAWVSAPQIVTSIIQTGSLNIGILPYLQALVYIIIFAVGSVVFSWFWVQSAGMDARSQAKKMMASGLQIPGFRKDPRIMERILQRYIGPLTIMGGIAVGLLAAIADIVGAFGTGTGILLTVMILYKMYEDIAKKHLEEMNPAMKNLMGG
jgi:preprotein translocase subunit SecY